MLGRAVAMGSGSNVGKVFFVHGRHTMAANRPSKLLSSVEYRANVAYNMPEKADCPTIFIDGAKKFVEIRLPESNRGKGNARILAHTPLYTERDFRGAPDGVYTWIESEKGFFAVQVRSGVELATLHKNIAHRTESTLVYMAGECKKEGDTVSFNLESGTFKKHIVNNNANSMARNKQIETDITGKLRDMGFSTITRAERSFINIRTMPLTIDELNLYARIGYEVFIYNTKEECKGTAKSSVETEIQTLQNFFLKRYARELENAKNDTEKETIQARINKTKEEIEGLEAKLVALQVPTKYIPPTTGGRRTRRNRRTSRKRFM